MDTASLEEKVVAAGVPAHVAIIMDGNGRWAERRGEPRLAGHQEGAESVRAITRTARRVGCKALTLYAFSAQNWSRPDEEVAGLMQLLHDYLVGERDELLENDIRLEAAGQLDRLPSFVREPLEKLGRETAHCSSMVLTLCLSYGGREELVAMARAVAAQVRDEGLDLDRVDEALVARNLWTGRLPDPDLVIRTSGEQRISNFLLWGCAYAELMFVPVAWPEFRDAAFLEALAEYQRRERRFGLTGAQLRSPDGI